MIYILTVHKINKKVYVYFKDVREINKMEIGKVHCEVKERNCWISTSHQKPIDKAYVEHGILHSKKVASIEQIIKVN